MMSYAETLRNNTALYPFEKWKTYYEGNGDDEGNEAFAPENCGAAQAIMDNLLTGLVRIGQNASETAKLDVFRTAVEALNDLDEKASMIETVEREELCALFDAIGISAGLNPDNYADGEGIASEWRNW